MHYLPPPYPNRAIYHLLTILCLQVHLSLGKAMQLVILGLTDPSICSSLTRRAPTLTLRRLTIAMIKDVATMIEVGGVDEVGPVTAAAEAEAEVEKGTTTISASLWMQVGLLPGVEVVGMDRREGADEVGLKLHYPYDSSVFAIVTV